MQLPEELLRMSEIELKKVLTPKNEYKRQYYTNDTTNLTNIYKLKKRYKDVYIFEELGTKKVFSDNINDLYKLYFNDIVNFKKRQYQNFLSNCSDSAFALYIKKLAIEIFGEDNIDIQSGEFDDSYGSSKITELIVYYPEITITNSVELSHIMKDIYIRYKFYYSNGYKKRVLRLEFARTTFTDVEVANRYQFSHSNTGNVGRWSSSFCFGGVGLASTYNSLLGGNLKGITSFLIGFEEYLKWESIEGKPYRHLSELISRERYLKYSLDISESTKNKMYIDVIQKFNDFNYIYNLVEGKNIIKLSQDFINTLESYLTARYSQHVYYVINGESYVDNGNFESSIFDRDNKQSEVIFKGKNKKIKIIKTQTDIVTPEKKIHRLILNYIIQKLESELYNYVVNKQLELAI
jgi:hypothetical protein